MRVLDLFSGIGGFSLGLERAGMETVAFCEIDPFCQKVLAKHWPDVPIFDDIKTLKGVQLESIDVICGGYPCQPFSQAGKRLGKEDHRHLWPEYLRLIRELRPRWIIGENVAGHISMGLDKVLSDLEGEGYAWGAFVIPAVAVDAKHRRDRVWIVANAIGTGSGRAQTRSNNRNAEAKRESLSKINRQAYTGHFRTSGETMADSKGKPERSRLCESEQKGKRRGRPAYSRGEEWKPWSTEPAVGRVANGVPSRVDRLKCLGNAVVPQIVEVIGRAVLEIENDRLSNC